MKQHMGMMSGGGFGDHARRWLMGAVMVAACGGATGIALGQSGGTPEVDPDAAAETKVKAKAVMPADEPVPPALADQEKLLRKVRFRYLGSMRKTEIRQIGLAKLREFTDPLIFPKMLEIFKRDRDDVRDALLDHFADQKTNEGDATLAWCAVFDEKETMRAAATERLVKRVEAARRDGRAARGSAGMNGAGGGVAPTGATPSGATPASGPAAGSPAATPGASGGASVAAASAPVNNSMVDPDVSWRVKKIISNGMLQTSDEVAGAAAELAESLNLVEAIPQMINLQVQRPAGSATGFGDRAGGALAYIQVGTQQAFVSDLTPVVGDSAVAFDPTISVLTEGTVLRIEDAVVTTYRTIIHYPLTRLANANWDGRDTTAMKFDQKKWAEWYTKEFVPFQEKVALGEAEPKGPVGKRRK